SYKPGVLLRPRCFCRIVQAYLCDAPEHGLRLNSGCAEGTNKSGTKKEKRKLAPARHHRTLPPLETGKACLARPKVSMKGRQGEGALRLFGRGLMQSCTGFGDGVVHACRILPVNRNA